MPERPSSYQPLLSIPDTLDQLPPSRPGVHRLVYLAVQEILADPDPAEAAHREWLRRRLDAECAVAASAPRQSATRRRST